MAERFPILQSHEVQTWSSIESAAYPLRPEDLIPAFLDCLDDCKQELSLSVAKGQELETSKLTGRIDDEMGRIERRQEADD